MLGKKKVSYEEYFLKILLAKISLRKKSSNAPSRGIFSRNICRGVCMYVKSHI